MGADRTNLDIDNQSRSRIVSDIQENFFVEAGAGSGKTSMLVRRMVAMVENGIDISRICAITFTKAAAGEFYERFQKLLIERSSQDISSPQETWPGSLPAPTEVTRERCNYALQNIDLCFMGTIDSFCGMILSEHPSEAGIPSDAHIVTDEEAKNMYRQLFVKISSGEYGQELRELAKTFRMIHRDSQEVFVKGISRIMNNRNVHFNYQQAAVTDIDQQYASQKKDYLAALRCLKDHSELAYTGNKESREAWEIVPDCYRMLNRRWSTNYNSVLYYLKKMKSLRLIPEALNHHAVSLGALFVPGGKGKVPKWLEFTADDEGTLYEQLEKLQYDASMTFLMECVPVIEQVMREQGNLTYFDYLYYLRKMLKKDAKGDGKLIRYIYARHSYFLIDEFQDTNPMQAEVFFYLSAENPVPEWSACIPRKGSLFIVGDPKQSIYRFRSADVTSFLRVKKLFEAHAGVILTLSRNFRSTKKLCEYFNRVFTQMLPDETVDQSKYEEIPLPDETVDEFQGIYTYTAYTGKAADDYPTQTDPIRIADMIERIVGREEYQLRPFPGSELRSIRYSDIMVITSAKRALGPIMEELDQRSIPFRVEGNVPFASNEALHEIVRIFCAAVDVEDTIALYGALTGKLLDLTKEDILAYRALGGKVTIRRLNCLPEDCGDEAALRTQKQIELVRELHDMAGRLSPAALFSQILDGLHIYERVTSEKMEVVCYALELIRKAERAGEIVSHKDAAAYLRTLVSGASEEERCLSLDADKDCVKMANLHKVKGLEAPIVFLAASSASKHSAKYRYCHDEHGSEGYLFALEKDDSESFNSNPYFKTDEYPDEKSAEDEALKAEEKRLVYVAATRARNVLVLCDSIQINRGKEKHVSKWGPVIEGGLPDLYEILKNDIPAPRQKMVESEAAQLYEDAERQSVLKNRDAEKDTFEVKTPSRLEIPTKLRDETESLEAEISAAESQSVQLPAVDSTGEDTQTAESSAEGSHAVQSVEEEFQTMGGTEDTSGGTVHQCPALLGTMVHKLMEMLVSAAGKIDMETTVGEILRDYRTPSSEPYEDMLKEALEQVAQTITGRGYEQTNGLPQDILTTLLQADEVYCELPFSYLDQTDGQKTVWNGVMDVVYQKNGHWHIVDYKTNADGSDLDLRYQKQMEAYTKAFREITGEEADAKTYHIQI